MSFIAFTPVKTGAHHLWLYSELGPRLRWDEWLAGAGLSGSGLDFGLVNEGLYSSLRPLRLQF